MASTKIKLSSKFILLVMASLILLHLTLSIIYQGYAYQENKESYRDKISQQIINTLHLMRVAPDDDAKIIAKVSEIKELSVKVKSKAIYPIQVDTSNYWQVNNVLLKNFDEKHISVKLDNGKWANFSYSAQPWGFGVQIGIFILEITVAGILLFCAWYIERFTEPLKKLKQMAERLGIQLQPEPIVEYGPAIVRETADAMNQMQKRIVQLISDRNQMLAAISHDLRTPLTRLKLRCQFIKDTEVSGESLGDIDEMEQMIDQILTYSRDASRQEGMTDLDLIALLQTICDEKEEVGHSIKFLTDVKRLAFKCRPLATKRALNNIIGNATKYANDVLLSLSIDKNRVWIRVNDDGPGIPEHLLKRVFSPFYRVDQSRSKATGGNGLGLAIAHDIITEHGGTIELSNRPEGGLSVIISYPAF